MFTDSFKANSAIRMCFGSDDELTLEIKSASKSVTHRKRDQGESDSCSPSVLEPSVFFFTEKKIKITYFRKSIENQCHFLVVYLVGR